MHFSHVRLPLAVVVLSGLSASVTAVEPAAPPRVAYGPDFSVVVPPGFVVSHGRGRLGDVLVLTSAVPRQEWTIARGPPMGNVTTQVGCAAAAERQARSLGLRRDAPRMSQAIAEPAGNCRYRIMFASGAELRVFIVTDAYRSFVTTCETGPDAKPDESCTILTDGIVTFAPEVVRVGGLSVRMPAGFVLGYFDDSQAPDTIVLDSTSDNSEHVHRRIQVQVFPGDWSGSCQTAGDQAARISRLELVNASEGTAPARCRASLRTRVPGFPARVEVRWRTVGAHNTQVTCTMDENDDRALLTCDEALRSIVDASESR